MSLSQMRPRTSQLVELHVFYVPAEVWNFKLNTVPVALASKFISAGFIRVSPHITLRGLREKLGEYLGGVTVADKFRFLKCIGKKLAVGHGNLNELHIHDQIFIDCSPPPVCCFTTPTMQAELRAVPCLQVKAKQETELELKSFAPPYALYPELYLLPGVEYFEDVYPLPSSTQQRHHFNAETSKFGHETRLPSLPQQKPDKNKPFLESIQSKHQLENLEVHSPVEWSEKEPVSVVHTNHEQDHNTRIQEQIEFREKELKNMTSNDHQKDTKLREDGTQDAEILKIMEGQTTEYVHKPQSLQQYSTRKSIANLGEKLVNQADENKQNHLTCPKEYISPPSPPLLSVNPAQVPVIRATQSKMVEQLQQMKKDRRHMEKTREELIKKAKGLLEQNKLRRYHVREEWKKKYFETKKVTVSLEGTLNKLRQDFELYHQKLLLQLEARYRQKRPNNTINSKNYTIIRIATVQHELDHLQRKLAATKMKLIMEIKMRKQAASDLPALRAELTQKKIHSALILQSRKSGI